MKINLDLQGCKTEAEVAEAVLGAVDGQIEKLQKDSDEARGKDREELLAAIADVKEIASQAQKSIDEAERRRLPGLEVMDPAKDTQKQANEKFSLFRYAQYKAAIAFGNQAPGLWDLVNRTCGLEMAVVKEMSDRTDSDPAGIDKAQQHIGTDQPGGIFVPSQVDQTVIGDLKATSVFMQAGVMNLGGFTGIMVFPKKLSAVSTQTLNTENEETLTVSTIMFGDIEVRPRPYGAAVKMSWQQMRHSAISMEAILRQDMAEELGLLVDLHIGKGSGQSGQPIGISNTTGIGSISWSGVTFGTATDTSQATLRSHYNGLENNNALGNEQSLAWVGQPAARQTLADSLDADGRSLYMAREAGRDEATVRRLLGFPVFTSTQLNNAAASAAFWLFGRMNQAIHATYGGLDFAATDSDSTDFLSGSVKIRAIGEHDVAVRYPEAFNLASSFDAS